MSLFALSQQHTWSMLLLFTKVSYNTHMDLYKELIDFLLDTLPMSQERNNFRFSLILAILRVQNYKLSEEFYDKIMKVIVDDCYQLLKHFSSEDDRQDKLVQLFSNDEVMSIPSMFKLIPNLFVQLLFSSKHPTY